MRKSSSVEVACMIVSSALARIQSSLGKVLDYIRQVGDETGVDIVPAMSGLRIRAAIVARLKAPLPIFTFWPNRNQACRARATRCVAGDRLYRCNIMPWTWWRLRWDPKFRPRSTMR